MSVSSLVVVGAGTPPPRCVPCQPVYVLSVSQFVHSYNCIVDTFDSFSQNGNVTVGGRDYS